MRSAWTSGSSSSKPLLAGPAMHFPDRDRSTARWWGWRKFTSRRRYAVRPCIAALVWETMAPYFGMVASRRRRAQARRTRSCPRCIGTRQRHRCRCAADPPGARWRSARQPVGGFAHGLSPPRRRRSPPPSTFLLPERASTETSGPDRLHPGRADEDGPEGLRPQLADVQIVLERIHLPPKGIAPHRDVQPTECLLVGAAVFEAIGKQDHPGARTIGGHATRQPFAQQFAQPEGAHELVDRRRFPARDHQGVDLCDLLGAAHPDGLPVPRPRVGSNSLEYL